VGSHRSVSARELPDGGDSGRRIRLAPEAFLREAALVAGVAASVLVTAVLLLGAAIDLGTAHQANRYQMDLATMSCCGAEEVLGPYVMALLVAPALGFLLGFLNRSRSRRLRRVTIARRTNNEGV
jgi:ribose/xylose/arabinose/galactoside ABC-type transport system permease subunit